MLSFSFCLSHMVLREGSAPVLLTAKDRDFLFQIDEPAEKEDSADSRFGQLVDPAAALYGLDIRTTIMMRRVPRRLAQEDIKKLIENVAGMTNSVEFLYLPRDVARRSNRGFCFANFHNHVSIGILASLLASKEGVDEIPSDLQKIRLYYAKIQGTGDELRALIEPRLDVDHA
jgi:RNA recognition motif 2